MAEAKLVVEHREQLWSLLVAVEKNVQTSKALAGLDEDQGGGKRSGMAGQLRSR